MEREYLVAFSSFYKAAYGQDMLAEAGIRSSLRKLPTELVKSCGTGLYLRTDSIEEALEVFRLRQIMPVSIHQVLRQGRGQRSYEKIQF